MKKILFATTALVATAGVAAVDVAVSGGAEMGLFGGTGIETQFFTDIDVTHLGLGVGYTVDAITVSANWGRFDGDFTDTVIGTALPIDQTGWGVAAAYDLGGGASVHVGYGSSEDTQGVTSDSWSLGVAMSF